MEPRGRVARAVFPGGALALSLLSGAQPVPPSFAFQDLASELATRIAATITPGDALHVVPANREEINQAALREVARLLTARGLRVVDREDGVPIVRVSCSRNLRGRVCAAEIRKGDAREVVMVGRDHDSPTQGAPIGSAQSEPPALPVVLEVRPVFAQRAPILDLAVVGTRLIVLDPGALTLYQRTENAWRFQDSLPISPSRPWPRDARGRVRVDGTRLEAFAQGLTCRGAIEPLTVTCTDDRQPWPIGIDNTGMAAARNYFTSLDGQTYYAVAGLGADAGARWLVAAQDGRLIFLDDARRALEATTPPGEDLVAVTTSCAPGSHVLLSSQGSATADGAETLRLFRVAARQFMAVTPPIVLPGPLTALWATTEADRAVAVSRNAATGRYEAFQIGVACGR